MNKLGIASLLLLAILIIAFPILGDDASTSGGGNQIGVAAGGTGSTTDIHEAFQWVLAPCDSSGASLR